MTSKLGKLTSGETLPLIFSLLDETWIFFEDEVKFIASGGFLLW